MAREWFVDFVIFAKDRHTGEFLPPFIKAARVYDGENEETQLRRAARGLALSYRGKDVCPVMVCGHGTLEAYWQS